MSVPTVSLRAAGLLLTVAGALAGCDGGAGDGGDSDDSDVASTTWRAFLLADTHVIASYYTCCESPGLDTISIYRTGDRLRYTADLANQLVPRPERGFVMGDVFHDNYHYGDDLQAYLDNESAIGNAKTLLDRFAFPMDVAFGNHDYDLDEASRAFSHELFDAVMGVKPYYAVDHRGFRFLMLNSQLGDTWDEGSAAFDPGTGSFGKEQLTWAAKQLDDGMPTFLMFHHHPLAGTLAREELSEADAVRGTIRDVYDLAKTYADNVEIVFAGHLHRWIDADGTAGFVGDDSVPWYVLGAVRYDAENFWLLELDEATGDWSILDKDKAQFGTTWSYDTTYGEDGSVTVDDSSDPAYDPAYDSTDEEDQANGWTPPFGD